MLRFNQWAAIAAIVVAGAAAQAAPRDNLDVRVSLPNPVLRGDVDVTVTVTVTNTNRHPVNLLKWQLPTDELEGALFRITRDDQPVAYLGPLVKRTAPQASDKVKLDAGASLSYEVELTGAYDLSQSGRYKIEYLSRGKHDDAAALASAPVYVWLEGRSGTANKPAPPPGASGSLAFSGNCSSTQQSTIASAVASATTYATGAKSYLSGRVPNSSTRYTTWFGTLTSPGWSTAGANFVAIEEAFRNKPLVVDCKCKKANIYAYVYPTQPYKIYVCGAFWSAPLIGTDSKAGTLIHEMSHFNAVAGTDDWAYGQTAAKALALSDPTKALDNADSHEYFAENTPAQN